MPQDGTAFTGLPLTFDPDTQVWAPQSTLPCSPLIGRGLSMFSSLLIGSISSEEGPRQSSSACRERMRQPAGGVASHGDWPSAAQNVNMLCLMAPNPERHPAPMAVRLQLFGDPGNVLLGCTLKVTVRGKPVPVSFSAPDMSSTTGLAVSAEPTLHLGPESAPRIERASSLPTVNGAHGAVAAQGEPFTLLIDLSGCDGPGLVVFEMWSLPPPLGRTRYLLQPQQPQLLGRSSGLLLPRGAPPALMREIQRHHRSWTELMLADLGALVEVADGLSRGTMVISAQEAGEWPVGGAITSGRRSGGAAPVGGKVAVAELDWSHVCLLLCKGQSLVCAAEDNGWQSTEDFVDAMLQFLEALLKGDQGQLSHGPFGSLAVSPQSPACQNVGLKALGVSNGLAGPVMSDSQALSGGSQRGSVEGASKIPIWSSGGSNECQVASEGCALERHFLGGSGYALGSQSEQGGRTRSRASRRKVVRGVQAPHDPGSTASGRMGEMVSTGLSLSLEPDSQVWRQSTHQNGQSLGLGRSLFSSLLIGSRSSEGGPPPSPSKHISCNLPAAPVVEMVCLQAPNPERHPPLVAVRLQLFGDPGGVSFGYTLKVKVCGKSVPVSLSAPDLASWAGLAASAETVLRLGPESMLRTDQVAGGPADAGAHAAVAEGRSFTLFIDLSGCDGPGLMVFEMWSLPPPLGLYLLQPQQPQLLGRSSGLLLPCGAPSSVRREIQRHHRSWTELMLADLGALVEVADGLSRGRMVISGLEGPAGGAGRKEDKRSGGASAAVSSPAVAAGGKVAVALERSRVGLLLCGGQSLVCAAEERGWRTTEVFLDDMLHFLEALLKGGGQRWPSQGPFRSLAASRQPPGCQDLDLKGPMYSAFAGMVTNVWKLRSARAQRSSVDSGGSNSSCRLVLNLNGRGVHQSQTASEGSALERRFLGDGGSKNSSQAAHYGQNSSSGDGSQGGKLAAAFAAPPMIHLLMLCLTAVSTAHGMFHGQGRSCLAVHALIAWPHLCLTLLGGIWTPSKAKTSGKRSAFSSQLAGLLQAATILCHRAALLLMLKGTVAIPFAVSAALKLGLDWHSHLLIVYLEGPWSNVELGAKALVDALLHFAMMRLLGEQHAVERAVAGQALTMIVYCTAFREMFSRK